MSQELRRGRSVPRKGDSGSRGAESPLGSPLFRRRQFTFEASDPCLPSSPGPFGPSSRAASRDSSPSGFHAIVERVCSSPKLGLRRLAVGRSGSFNDVSANPGAGGSRKSVEAKSRRRWMRGAGIGRSESMRSAMPPKRAMDGSLPVISKSKSRDAGGTVWTSDEDEDAESLGGSSSGLPSSVSAAAFDPRRGSLPPFALSPSPVRDRSLDRVARLERRGRLAYSHSLDGGGDEPGKMKGFVKATISVNR